MTQIEMIASVIRQARKPLSKAEIVPLLLALGPGKFSRKQNGRPQDRPGIMGILSRVLDVDVARKGGTSRFVKIGSDPVRWAVRARKR